MNKLISKIFNKHQNTGEFVHANSLQPLAKAIGDLQKDSEPDTTNYVKKIEAGENNYTLVLTYKDDTTSTITIKVPAT